MSSGTTSSSSNRSKYESMDLSGSVYLVSGDGKIINLPRPSNSPRDPLNWSAKKKALAYLAIGWSAVTALVAVQGVGLLVVGILQEFSVEDMRPFGFGILASSPSLFMAIGTLIWIPLSMAIGRRPTFLLSCVVSIVAMLWAGLTNSFPQYLAALCLSGLAEGFSLSAVIDLTFVHERPKAIAMIWCLPSAAASAIFCFAPYMSAGGTNRKLFYQIWVIPSIVSLILAYLFYPETYFIRPVQAFDGRILAQSATEKTEFYESWEECPGGKELPDHPDNARWWFMRYEYRIFITTRAGWRGMLACYPQIALCTINPLIFWVALLQIILMCSMLSMDETIISTLSSAPYNLSATSTALMNLGPALAALLAWPASGHLLSMATKKLAMNNRGIREAEYFLPAFILPVVTATLSNVLYGLAIQRNWHFGVIIFAFSLNAFAFLALGNAGTLWVTEAFPRWAAPSIVVVYGVAYVVSAFMSYAIMPWIRSQGIEAMQLELGLVTLVVGCIGVPMAFFGKRVRQRINGTWAESEAGALRPQSSHDDYLKRDMMEGKKRNADVELNIVGDYER